MLKLWKIAYPKNISAMMYSLPLKSELLRALELKIT